MAASSVGPHGQVAFADASPASSGQRPRAFVKALRSLALPLSLTSILLTVGCDSDFSPAKALPGAWISSTSLPGTYTTMTLATSGGSVTGTGTRFIEAGPPAPFDIVGTRRGISVSLSWFFPSGELATYKGQLLTADHIHGMVLTTTGDTFPEDFYRQ